MDAIRENRSDGKPFFAYLAFTAPHDPIHVPEPWLSKYRGKYDDGYEVLKQKRAAGAKAIGVIPENAELPALHDLVRPWKNLSKAERAQSVRGMEGYAGMVDNMDYHYSRVVKFLKDIGQYENTIIIFLSDNGSNPWDSEDYPGNRGSKWFEQFNNETENIGHPGSNYAYGIGWASASSGPLDYFKMAVGEGGIRSPTVVAGPGIKGGRQVDSFAYVWDLMPTILDLVGLEHPAEFRGRKVEPLRGRSLARVLSGDTEQTYGADSYVGGEMGTGKWMRKGDYKAVSVAKPYGPSKWQLFNVVADPGETHDLSNDKPEILRELQDAWKRYAEDVGVVMSK
jgi:arylsulfatase